MRPWTLPQVGYVLRNAERHGAQQDIPEGARCCSISDTLAHEMAATIDTLNWRPHTDPPAPDAPVFTALIAVEDDDEPGAPFIAGLYQWQWGAFGHEDTGRPPSQRRWWWLAESALLAQIPCAITEAEQSQEATC